MKLVHVTIYKEPLRPVPKEIGFGYYGAILGTEDGALIQCHICGNLYSHLSSHVRHKHNIKSREYKERFLIAYSTSLVSSQERKRLIAYMMERIESEGWTGSKAEKYGLMGSESRKKGQPKLTLETLNKRGTCPDQLLNKINEVYLKLGHPPTLDEFEKATGGQKYKHLIYKTFGSYNEALKTLGIPHRTERPDYTCLLYTSPSPRD